MKILYTLLFLSSTAFVYSCREETPIAEWYIITNLPAHYPIEFKLDKLSDSIQNLEIRNSETGNIYPAQRINDQTVVAILSETIQTSATLRLYPSDATGEIRCTLISDEDFIKVSIDGNEVMRYAVKTIMPPDTLPSYYQRSGFIHPLKSLSGKVLTADFPKGHAHQHGIFDAWVNTTYRGEQVDFWNQQNEEGTVRHVEILSTENGQVYSSFSVRLEHLAFINSDTISVLDEVWQVRIYPTEDYYLVDWSSVQTPLTGDTLFINEYHYGGFAFRGSELWNKPNAYDSLVFVTTNEGKSQIDGNHSTPNWVDMYGIIDGDTAGVAILNHSSNFRFPQPVRIHPEMPYFVFTPSVEGPFFLAPGDTYRAKYRLLVHDGKPDTESIENARLSFENVIE